MIAIDSNLLVYAHRADSSWHHQAERIVVSLAEGSTQWAIPWPCVYEFIAIVTHPRIYKPPTPLSDALEQIQCWMDAPGLVLLHETNGFFETFSSVLKSSKMTGPGVHDARVAALCIRHRVVKLLTADRDFSRFPQLRIENPLIEKTSGRH